MGEQLLRRFGVPFHDFTLRQVKLGNYLAKIIYRSRLEITSTVALTRWESGLTNTLINVHKQRKCQGVRKLPGASYSRTAERNCLEKRVV